MIKIYTAEPEIMPLHSTYSSSCPNLAPALPDCSLSDITGGNLSDYVQLPLEPQKALHYLLNICRSWRSYTLITHQSCTHNLDMRLTWPTVFTSNL